MKCASLVIGVILFLAATDGSGQATKMPLSELDVLFNRNPDSAMQLLKSDIAVGRSTDDKDMEYIGHSRLSSYYMGYSMLDSAIWHGRQALRLTRTIQPMNVPHVARKIGEAFHKQGMPDSAMHYYLIGEKAATETDTTLIYLYITLNIADVYHAINDYESERVYLGKAKAYLAQADDISHVDRVIAYQDFVNFYWAIQDSAAFTETLAEYLRLIKPFEENIKLPEYHYEMFSFGITDTAEWVAAMEASIAMHMERRRHESIAVTQYILASIKRARGDLVAALAHVESGLQSAIEGGLANSQRSLLYMQYEINDALGRPSEALDAHRRYHAINDSITELKARARVSELQIQFDTEKKETQILNQQLQISRQERAATALLAGLIGLGILLAGVWYVLRLRLRSQKALAEKERQIQEQQIKELQTAQKLLALDAMIDGQEEERRRIAGELHDGLGGLLASVKMQYEIAQQEGDKGDLQQLLDDASTEVRRISHAMMPRALERFGLTSAVGDIANDLRKGGYQVTYDVLGVNERLPAHVELNLYRITQELTNNIVKYADASHILIQLSQFENTLSLTIEDDGKGFDPAAATASNGIGLKNLRSRVEYLNGNLEIDAAPGEGSAFVVEVGMCS